MTPGYFLAIAGNIGAGKTELTTRLSQELGWLAYYEPVIQNPYLDPFYADMPRWSFHLQIYFLSERYKAQVEISKSSLPFIQDRTIYEDAEIFARTLREQGSMTEVDYQNYSALFEVLTSHLRPPDLIVYLQARPATLMERIARRGRPSEQGIGIDYIQRLNLAYDGWMERARVNHEVLTIDTDAVALQGDSPAFRSLVDDLKQRYPRQAELDLPG
ncbi:MAG: deoxynucleoside kinase [Candidatus Eisenbacteria bacterium]|uniref:Deoxynucleoside kinase n=1 Tax=Eiseniibacteriota bacterium TaxID=2212470 RepID=A0A849SA36_UNCEI|nr:deoxynucleoside kinase [Candidatus Eisenbacteria bacterium]